MKGKERRDDSAFGVRLNELLLPRRLNRTKLAELIKVDAPTVTNLCKEDLHVTPAVRRHLRAIIKVMHAIKPLSLDEANQLLTTIPTVKELDARDDQGGRHPQGDDNDLSILNLLQASDQQSNGMNSEVSIKKSAGDASTSDIYQPVGSLQPINQNETDEEVARVGHRKRTKQRLGVNRYRLKRYYALLALVCVVILFVLAVWHPFISAEPIPPSISLTPLLYQAAPDCNNPSGTLWTFPLPDTRYSCLTNGLLMQKNSRGYYAEADLDNVRGTPYNQTKFGVHTQVTFENPNDTLTRAALLVQTPQTLGVAGGYMCTLNSSGQWQLLEVEGATAIPVIRQGAVTINLAHPTTITVEVQNSTLYCAIDGKWVVSWPDNLNPSPGAVSLMVIINSSVPSSSIVFSNFEVDQ